MNSFSRAQLNLNYSLSFSYPFINMHVGIWIEVIVLSIYFNCNTLFKLSRMCIKNLVEFDFISECHELVISIKLFQLKHTALKLMSFLL